MGPRVLGGAWRSYRCSTEEAELTRKTKKPITIVSSWKWKHQYKLVRPREGSKNNSGSKGVILKYRFPQTEETLLVEMAGFLSEAGASRVRRGCPIMPGVQETPKDGSRARDSSANLEEASKGTLGFQIKKKKVAIG